MTEPTLVNVKALVRLPATELVGLRVTPASLPASLGARPGDYVRDLDQETAERWVAAGIAEIVVGPIPATAYDRE